MDTKMENEDIGRNISQKAALFALIDYSQSFDELDLLIEWIRYRENDLSVSTMLDLEHKFDEKAKQLNMRNVPTNNVKVNNHRSS